MGVQVEVPYDRVIRDCDTDGAVLYEIDGAEVWLPRSAHDCDPDELVLYVDEDMAFKKGLI